MRCDCCPLCPIAEDEVCAIAETEEWGIEHKDGMMGCRHSYNWCKKKADEYADYLGKMGQEMAYGMEMEHKGFEEGYAKGRAEAITELKDKYLDADSYNEGLDDGITDVLDILERLDTQMLERVKDVLYGQDYEDQKK